MVGSLCVAAISNDEPGACPTSHTTVLMDQGHDPVSNSVCSNIWELLWTCIVLLLWKNASQEMPLLASPSFQTYNAIGWSQVSARLLDSHHIYPSSTWRPFLVSELSFVQFSSFCLPCHGHGTNSSSSIPLSQLFKVIRPSAFSLRLLIHVLLPHIWLWAWSHFLDLIPSSCLLPALSHRG